MQEHAGQVWHTRMRTLVQRAQPGPMHAGRGAGPLVACATPGVAYAARPGPPKDVRGVFCRLCRRDICGDASQAGVSPATSACAGAAWTEQMRPFGRARRRSAPQSGSLAGRGARVKGAVGAAARAATERRGRAENVTRGIRTTIVPSAIRTALSVAPQRPATHGRCLRDRAIQPVCQSRRRSARESACSGSPCAMC